MRRYLLAFLALFLFSPYEARADFVTISNCDNIPSAQRTANGTFCLQTTTASGRTAGTTWVWDGATWVSSSGGGGAGHVIKEEGASLPARANLNFIGPQITATDNVGTNSSDVTSGITLQDEGGSLTQRNTWNCVGAGISCTDAGGKNVITVPGGSTDVAASYAWTGANSWLDGNFSILNTADPTKIIKFSLTGQTTGTTRTYTLPNASTRVIGDADFSTVGCMGRTAVNTYAGRTLTGTPNNISIVAGDCVAGNPTIDVGANVALSSRSFAPTTGAWNFAAATSFTVKQATNYSPASDGMCGEDTVAFRLKCNLNGVVYTLAHLSEIQPLSTNLTALSGLTGVNGRIPYFTGPGTMALTTGLETPCIDSGGQHLNLTAVGTFSCGTSSTGGISGGTTNVLAKYASPSTLTPSIISEAAGVATVGGGFVVGTAPYLVFNTAAITPSDITWTIQNISGTITPATGVFTNGHVVVATVAAGITTLTDGGVAGTGTWTDSSTSTGTNKTLVATGAGGTNAITLPIVASFDGGSITADGTNCQDPVKTTINSGPTQYVVLCATPASAQWDIMVPMLKQAVSTFIVRLEVNDTVSSSHVYAGTFKAQCRASGAAPSSTWGTTQTVSITMVTANNSYQAATTAITANGTCSADSTLYVRFNASGSMTDTGTARVTGVRIFQAS